MAINGKMLDGYRGHALRIALGTMVLLIISLAPGLAVPAIGSGCLDMPQAACSQKF